MFFPWVLIVLGVIFLFQNLGLLPIGFWGYFWPLVLIAFGFALLNKRGGYCCGPWCNHKSSKDQTDQNN